MRSWIPSANISSAVSDFGKICPARFEYQSSLLRVTAWIQRFIAKHRIRRRAPGNVATQSETSSETQFGNLTAEDIRLAQKWLIAQSQRDSFHQKLADLQAGRKLNAKSSLIGCRAFIDEDGLIKTRGRVEVAVGVSNSIPVLANDHPVTRLLIEDAHRRLIHAGTKHTLYQLLHEYFILQGRQATARVVRNCIRCRREKAVPANQPPGPLPVERCTRGEPFEAVRVDFAGPLFCRGRVYS